MDFSRFFIDRPIFAAVLSILIFITGLIAIPLLPVSEYPDVVPPSVQVRAEYPGANPKVIAETVATPLEEAINGVENMMYMKSVAGSDGVLVTTVTFRPGTDPDQAQVQVQNRVAQAEARLPEDVRRLGITTQKQSPTLTLVVHLFSPNGKYDSLYMRNYATLKVKDELARLPGVGQIQIFGSGEYAMRVWLDPNKVAARGLTAFLPILAIVSLAPAVPTLIQHFAGVPYVETLVPLMLTAPGLVIAIAGPCTGWLADKFGRRKLLLSATLLYGICGTMPLYITSLTGIFCSRLGVGLAEAVVLTIANTMLIDYFDDKQRRFWLTVQGVIGPALAVLVLASSGYLTALRWNGAFMIYFVAILLFLAMYFWMFEPAQAARPQHAAQAAQHNPFPWPRVIALSVLTFVCAIIYYVYTINGANAFHTLQNASPQRIGLIMSLVSLAVPVGSLLFGLVSRRYTPERVLAIMLCLMGIGMLVVGESRTLIAMGIGSAIQQLGAGMAINAMIYWVGSLIPPAYCGRAMGAWSGAFFAGMFVSPIIVGAIRLRAGNDVLSAFLTLGIAALVLAAAIFLYTFSRHSQRLRQHKQASAWQLAK